VKQQKTVNLARFKLEIASVTLEQLDGEEEIAALERANGSPSAGMEQLVAQSIVAVDGEAVVRPYVDWKKWKSRTRDFVRSAFHRYCSASAKELDDFLKAEFGEVGAEPGEQP
jgi:hypothetical protein